MRSSLFLALIALAACSQTSSESLVSSSIPPRAASRREADPTVVLHLQALATGLNRPLDLDDANDGSGRLFVTEQDGRIRVLKEGHVQDEAFLDMARVADCDLGGALGRRALGFTPSSAGNERGLLGLAFHPKFADNGLFFVDYTDGQGDTVLARFQVRTDGRADPTSCAALLRVDQPFPNHNGGDIKFGPDGRLYVALGDGGSANDPCDHASTLTASALDNRGRCAADAAFLANGGNADSRALLGKLLRLDVDHPTPTGAHGLCAARADGSAGYSVPNDNAFAGDAARACGETWTAGWRNPWRFAFDRSSGDLYVGDVGQNEVEEIDRIAAGTAAGGHYGWRGCEGDRDANGGHCTGHIAPLLTYRHDHGRCSVTGGALYRGSDVALQGRYLFGDYCTGEIFIADPATGRFAPAQMEPALAMAFGISSFGEDAQGRVFVIQHGLQSPEGGTVYELRATR